MQYPEKYRTIVQQGFTDSSVGKASACNVGDLDSVPELGRPPGAGKGCPPQCSGLEKPWAVPMGHRAGHGRVASLHSAAAATRAALTDRQGAGVPTAEGRGWEMAELKGPE